MLFTTRIVKFVQVSHRGCQPWLKFSKFEKHALTKCCSLHQFIHSLTHLLLFKSTLNTLGNCFIAFLLEFVFWGGVLWAYNARLERGKNININCMANFGNFLVLTGVTEDRFGPPMWCGANKSMHPVPLLVVISVTLPLISQITHQLTHLNHSFSHSITHWRYTYSNLLKKVNSKLKTFTTTVWYKT